MLNSPAKFLICLALTFAPVLQEIFLIIPLDAPGNWDLINMPKVIEPATRACLGVQGASFPRRALFLLQFPDPQEIGKDRLVLVERQDNSSLKEDERGVEIVPDSTFFRASLLELHESCPGGDNASLFTLPTRCCEPSPVCCPASLLP